MYRASQRENVPQQSLCRNLSITQCPTVDIIFIVTNTTYGYVTHTDVKFRILAFMVCFLVALKIVAMYHKFSTQKIRVFSCTDWYRRIHYQELIFSATRKQNMKAKILRYLSIHIYIYKVIVINDLCFFNWDLKKLPGNITLYRICRTIYVPDFFFEKMVVSYLKRLLHLVGATGMTQNLRT